MQWWLDMIGSNRHDPNENFARELMELFTLGVGHYSERDVREAARAFTGYDYDWDQRRYRWNPDHHDAGVKTLFGHRGRFGPDDVVNLCLRHPAHAPYLRAQAVELLHRHAAVGGDDAAASALTYRRSGFELRPVLRMILSSRAFNANLDEPDLVKPPVVYAGRDAARDPPARRHRRVDVAARRTWASSRSTRRTWPAGR